MTKSFTYFIKIDSSVKKTASRMDEERRINIEYSSHNTKTDCDITKSNRLE